LVVRDERYLHDAVLVGEKRFVAITKSSPHNRTFLSAEDVTMSLLS
jgi:hypothetical protein